MIKLRKTRGKEEWVSESGKWGIQFFTTPAQYSVTGKVVINGYGVYYISRFMGWPMWIQQRHPQDGYWFGTLKEAKRALEDIRRESELK